ncbi:NAD-dependent epimerase/dehydratase family protein [Conexibacter sp. W3-3-2]|uniref:GDP-mannose 4,6-dehydratase n=1 Tax=Conexibacter sp. W3-3-2 TaxID=2675227 RepID=UPI001322BB36|nr:GDP-mannose 4,6-dehydratase [Conexibacter sp. W3-3-2]MTD46209.1 NAD-dependent epimerase/dehydratase family protein [Conexibacter sp. W3-3-2]
MPRALITGIAGQDGSYLADLLLEDGTDVVGLIRAEDRDGPNLAHLAGRVRLVEGDLLDPASLRAAVGDVAPDELYHLAAPTFVPASWDDPTTTVAAIAGATSTILAAARETDPAMRVYVATSSEIFGDAGVSPQDEDSPKRPRSPYGVAKLAAHQLIALLRERHGQHVSAGITFNHESPRRPPHFVPRKITRGAAAISLGLQDELRLGDLGAQRDWTDARDVVRGAVLALRHDVPGDYVFASGVPRTVKDLVDAAFAHVGVDPAGRVVVDPEFVRPPEPTQLLGDPTRAREVLGWEPRIGFAQMIGEMVETDLAELRAAG